MRKLIAIILTMVLLGSCCACFAEEDFGENEYDTLTVGVTTAFSGNFLGDALGNNISDKDIRKMIHSYHLVSWDGDVGVFKINEEVVTGALASEDQNTFHFSIAKDMTYNDGTPITAKDYAFSFLLMTSKALNEAVGLREDGSRILGWKAYDEGTASAVSGFRLIGDYQMSISLAPEFTPYFYQMQALDFYPLPISVIAPGCEVKDDGEGIYLSGAFDADTIRKTILDPETGYAAHPGVTSGPYMITEYDGKTVWLKTNPNYKGDIDGNRPIIENVIVRYVPSTDLLSALIVGDVDMTTRSIRTEQVATGMALAAMDEYALKSYSRNGLAFISFCGEKGPTADPNVRKALAMCLDKAGLNAKYSGNQGLPVDGYYGIGQWMFPMTRGQIPEAWQEENPDETWEDFNLEGLTVYPLDVEAAKKLLDEAGWNLNADAGAWTEGLRYKNIDGMLTPLTLRLAYPTENLAGPMLQEFFAPYLREAGAELEVYPINMPDLLPIYYGQVERNYDMIMIGSNFQDVFDPSVYYDENGKDRLNGITDPQLAELAKELRQTEPGNGAEYVRRWIKYLEYRSEVLPEIPLYSNAYMDFHISALRDYAPAATSSWSEAVIKAYMSDDIEETEDQEGLEDWLGEGEAEFD